MTWSWFRRVVVTVFGCRHPHLRRERRPVCLLFDDTSETFNVMHFVCDDCGFAVPVVDRSNEDHERAVKIGTPVPLKAFVVEQAGLTFDVGDHPYPKPPYGSLLK